MPPTIVRYIDWGLRILSVMLFSVAGFMKLIAYQLELQSFSHFGYETWFMYAIGFVELGAGIALMFARVILPAAGALAAILVGAVYSHLHAGDQAVAIAPALIALAMLAGLALIHWPKPSEVRLADPCPSSE